MIGKMDVTPPALGRPIRTFGFDRRKTWPFITMLLAMIGLGLFRLATEGLADAWGLLFVLVLLPGVALAMLLAELRLPGPVLLVGEAGLLDRRRGPEAIAWPVIQEATLQGRLLGKSIRIVLTDGRRYDIELNLLAADPYDVMRLVQDQASRNAD